MTDLSYRVDDGAARTARWVGALFLMGVLLQRVAVPGLPVSILVPAVAAWTVLAMRHGVVVLDRRRTMLWCVAVAATGAAVLAQAVVLTAPVVSLTSWALVLATTAPLICRLVDRRPEALVATLRRVVGVGAVLGAGCLVMTALQLLGVPYRDYVAEVVPSQFLLPGYVISYPYSYGSELYRANGWIGLEPSFVSFQLGVAILGAVLIGSRIRTVLLLAAAIVSTASGSGMFIVGVGVVVLLLWPRRRALARLVLPFGIGVLVLLSTPFGADLLARTAEVNTPQSSASLRAVEPYPELWSAWTDDAHVVAVGAGPGSAQDVVSATGVGGLLVPTPAKLFFEYGILGGLALAVFLLFCYLDSLSAAFAATLLVSLWTIQPGLTTMVLVINAIALVTLWSPREGPRLEEFRWPGRAAVSEGAR